ncbi:MAG: ribosome recycling factor [Synergistaceae bacterium]|jgi:ribosome recycling factor|nr:ribosome recycling factor [Synergistaceae bacterium]
MPKTEVKRLREKMDRALEFLKGEYLAIRTGRAHPGLVSDIKADYYGTQTPLKQMANITIPENRKILIAPFDRSSLKAVEKAILASNLGITPQNDGEAIRLTLPELTRERRVELTKLTAKKAEETRVVMRNHRRDAVESLKKMEKDSKITEDELKKYSKEVQDITDDFIKKIEETAKVKEKEIMEE